MSVEEIVNVLFGGQVTIDGIITLLIAVYTVVISIVSWRSKISVIRKVGEIKNKDAQIKGLEEEVGELKTSISGLADIITTAYLTNANVDPEVKKALAVKAQAICEISKIDISKAAQKLIDKATEYSPDSSLVQKAEDIKTKAAEADEILDTVGDKAEEALKRLQV